MAKKARSKAPRERKVGVVFNLLGHTFVVSDTCTTIMAGSVFGVSLTELTYQDDMKDADTGWLLELGMEVAKSRGCFYKQTKNIFSSVKLCPYSYKGQPAGFTLEYRLK